MTNAIRLDVAASLRAQGEARATGKVVRPGTLRGSVIKRCRGASSDWRRNDGKVEYLNQGDLPANRTVFMSGCRTEEPRRQESEQP